MATYRVLALETPPEASANDSTPIILGVEFTVSELCTLTEIRWWQPSTGTVSTLDRTVGLYTTTNGSSGTLVAGPESMPVAGSGWQTRVLDEPYDLVPGTVYTVAVHHSAGQYAATGGYFADDPAVAGPITFRDSTDAFVGNGKFAEGGSIAFPGVSFNSSNYWVDITVETQDAAPARFVVHDGDSWVPARGWAHSGTTWVETTPT